MDTRRIAFDRMKATADAIAANPGRTVAADADTIRAELGGIAEVEDEFIVHGGHTVARLRGDNGRVCLVVHRASGAYTATVYEQ